MKINILTFDVEEWFHILDNDSTKTEKEWFNYEYRLEKNMDKIFQLLNDKKQKATFFCLGWVARKFPHIIKRIDSMGFEIGTHSDMHQLVYEQKENEFKKDLEKSIKSIEDIIGKKIRIYRAPGFSIKRENLWVFEELVKIGIEIDCSIFPYKRAHGGFKEYGYAEPSIIDINGMKIKELPINIFKIFNKAVVYSGGGYFRLFPYFFIKILMKNSNYVMTYFHPRDFDYKQPIIKELSLIRKFKSYYGLRGAYKKLEKLLRDFKFIDIKEADNLINWEKVKKVKL